MVIEGWGAVVLGSGSGSSVWEGSGGSDGSGGSGGGELLVGGGVELLGGSLVLGLDEVDELDDGCVVVLVLGPGVVDVGSGVEVADGSADVDEGARVVEEVVPGVAVELGTLGPVSVDVGSSEVVVGSGSGASEDVVLRDREVTSPAGGSSATGSPSSAPIMKSVQIRAGIVPPVTSSKPPMSTSRFSSTSRPSPRYIPTAAASWPGVNPSNQAA